MEKKPQDYMFVIQKVVVAKNLKDALKKEKDVSPTSITIAYRSKDQLMPAIGFSNGSMPDEEEYEQEDD